LSELGDLRESATLGDLFVRSAQRFAAREAVVFGAQRLTYTELAGSVARIAAVLTSRGIARGSAVAILSPNRLEVLTVTLAAMVLGARLTPLSAMSSIADQQFILSDAEIDLLVIDESFADNAVSFKDNDSYLGQILAIGPLDGFDNLVEAQKAAPDIALIVSARGDDIAMLAYTGGTTGQPKGVVLTQAAALTTVLMATSEWDWPAQMNILAATPVSHAAGILAYPTFLKGGTFHMIAGFSAAKFVDYVNREHITGTFLVPTMIYRLLDDLDESVRLPSLSTVLYGAAPISTQRLIQAIKRFGPIFMQLYGQTEAPTCISYLPKSAHQIDDSDALTSCGVPLASVRITLLAHDGTPAEPGAAGEICVRGPFIMREYWKRPQETKAVFENGWLHTGDIGQFDSAGRLHIIDRKKDMIITGGLNVYPSEIEAVLDAHPDIIASAAFGRADAKWGEAVCVALVRQPSATLTDEDIRSLVRDTKGPIYAPKFVMFVEALPTTPIGKIDKKALKSLPI
jgi:fatty-acyl-CoA synthase